jgi:hypothetical protein
MTRKLSLCALAVLLAAGPVMAQRPNGGRGGQRPEGAPQRPAGTYGQPGNRPANAPPRPDNTRQRPENAPQRPPESRGQQGNRPANAPQRPAGTFQTVGQTPGFVAGN